MFLEPVTFQNYLLGMYMFRRTQRDYYGSLMLSEEPECERGSDASGRSSTS